MPSRTDIVHCNNVALHKMIETLNLETLSCKTNFWKW